MLDVAQSAVSDFSRLFDLPVSDFPHKLTGERVELRAKWMSEEIEEFRGADDISDQLDAIADLIYYALGVFVEMGVDGGRVFEFVHEANMAKLRPGKEPIYDSDRKVLKPEGWFPPKERIRQWLGSASPKPLTR
jgi:predicted HAD superfamily Cof-like phosphohydrolase